MRSTSTSPTSEISMDLTSIRENWRKEYFPATTMSLVLHEFFELLWKLDIKFDILAFGATMYDLRLKKGLHLTPDAPSLKE